jgi:phosphohistidine phosphatase
MPVLILMRHAKAVRDHEAASDRARGLTTRGRREAADAAVAMRTQEMAPSAVRASNAVRTVETAVIVGGDIAPMTECRFSEALYLAAGETIWREAMRAVDGDATVLMVGHNPGIQELAARLVERSGDRSALARGFLSDMATASWIAFEVDDDELDSTTARLVGGWTPDRGV